jgi:putative addiction module component (TIGR02574 family)
MPSKFPELDQLPADEKMMLAAELWSEATADEKEIEPDPQIVAILDERMAEYRKNPESAIPWEEVKRRLLNNG